MPSSSRSFHTRVVQVSNISPSANREQLYHMFSYFGRIDEMKIFPSETNPMYATVQSKLCYIKYEDSSSVSVAQHMTNTAFIDRALICVPIPDGKMPDEETALKTGGPALPGQRQLPPNVVNQIQMSGMLQVMMTVDPNLAALGLPPYPPLPANTESNKIEEIRRTIYVGNLPKEASADEVLEFFNQNIGEVMYLRMAGSDDLPAHYCYVEFSSQHSVATALQNNGIEFKGAKLRMQHSTVAIVKPLAKTQDMARREVEEAMRKAEASGSLVGGKSVDREDTMRRYTRSRSRSRHHAYTRSPSRDHHHHRSSSRAHSHHYKRSSSHRHSRSPAHKRSKSRSRDSKIRRSSSRSERRKSHERSHHGRSRSKRVESGSKESKEKEKVKDKEIEKGKRSEKPQKPMKDSSRRTKTSEESSSDAKPTIEDTTQEEQVTHTPESQLPPLSLPTPSLPSAPTEEASSPSVSETIEQSSDAFPSPTPLSTEPPLSATTSAVEVKEENQKVEPSTTVLLSTDTSKTAESDESVLKSRKTEKSTRSPTKRASKKEQAIKQTEMKSRRRSARAKSRSPSSSPTKSPLKMELRRSKRHRNRSGEIRPETKKKEKEKVKSCHSSSKSRRDQRSESKSPPPSPEKSRRSESLLKPDSSTPIPVEKVVESVLKTETGEEITEKCASKLSSPKDEMVVERPKFGHRSPTKSSTKRDAFDVSPAKRSRMASLASSYDDASEKESMDTSPVVPAPTFSPRKEGTDNSEEERRSKRGKASSHKKEKKEKKEKKAKRKKKEKETSNKKKRTKDYKPNGDSSGETSS